VFDHAIREASGYGNIVGVADATRFHLRSAHQILSTLFPDQPVFVKGLNELLRRMEFGLPASAPGLAALPIRFNRGKCLSLSSAAINTPDALRALGDHCLRDYIDVVIVSQLRPHPTDDLIWRCILQSDRGNSSSRVVESLAAEY
jgi:helicase